MKLPCGDDVVEVTGPWRSARLESMELLLCVPNPAHVTGARLGEQLVRGSAMVASVKGEHLVLDYEGDCYGIHRDDVPGVAFVANLMRAVGRSVESYPTTARRLVEPDAVVVVGQIETEGAWLHIEAPATLDAWLVGCTSDDVAAAHRRHRHERDMRDLVRAAQRGDASALRRLQIITARSS